MNHGIIKVVIIFLFAVIDDYCATARVYLGNARFHYERLAQIVPKNQYYKYHDQWRSVTQKLCFLSCLIMYLEMRALLNKRSCAETLGGM